MISWEVLINPGASFWPIFFPIFVDKNPPHSPCYMEDLSSQQENLRQSDELYFISDSLMY
jgi:hypothetical protein